MVASELAPRFVTKGLNGLGAADLESHVRYCLRAAILTRKGERALCPDVGSAAASFLWRPLDAGLKLELEAAVRHAVETGEPRVRLEAVDVEHDRSDATRLRVQLRYRLLANNKRDRLEVAL